jgi:small subunit ribosomal protein S17
MTETVTEIKKEASNERGRRRILAAVVISAKQDKTVRVEATYMVKHPRYNKYLRERTRLQVHDEAKEAKVGDQVEITECRPISKTKKWRLVRVVQKAKV